MSAQPEGQDPYQQQHHYEQQQQQQPQQDPTPPQQQETKPPKEKSADDGKYASMLSQKKAKINGGETKLLYVAPISDRIVLAHFMYFQMFPCSLALCNTSALKEQTYVHLYEDRLEWNYPSSCCATIYDNPGVLYLDRDIAEYQTIPSCCTPFCTHCSMAPTCWDAFGEVLMLSGESSCCWVSGQRNWGFPIMNTPAAYCCYCPMPFCGKPLPCLNKEWLFLPHLKDAQQFKFRVRKVRQDLAKAGHCNTAVEGITM